MEKLRVLLSAGAILGLVAGTANAGRLIGMDGNPATVSGTGEAHEADGFAQMGSPYTGSQGLEGESAVPFSVPAPGKVNMRINMFVNEFPMAAWWTGMNSLSPGNKHQAYGIYGWARFEFGIDGMTKSGIQYGGYIQIRENNTTSVSGGATSAASGFAQSASGDSGDNTLYIRHANVYIGTKEFGFLRIGTGLGSQTLYEQGLFDDFDIGGWISFASTNISGATPVWPWADEGGAYMAARIQYVSPVIDGFDFGVGFAPNNSGPFDGSGCAGQSACATQSSSTFGFGDWDRYRNEIDGAIRYRNSFGIIGFAGDVSYMHSGVVGDSTVGGPQFDGLSIWDAGMYVSIAKQLELGGNVMWGSFNGNWQLKPVGGKNALAWVTGVKYTIPQLPATVGAYYFNYKYNGLNEAAAASTRTSQGLDVGAVYGFGPGVVAVAEYAWGQVSQSGVNVETNAVGTAFNTATANVITLGMSVRF